jgi:murein peptide amidase A
VQTYESYVRLLALFLAALPVGHSVDGRTIRPVVLGSPTAAHRMLVVGCIHGNECAGVAIARRLVAAGAPPGARLVVVPNLNPDGFRAVTRENAHGVDLNRDFYTRSQPETRYAVSLIRRLRPEVTVWFHQPQALVRAWGPSVPTARRLAALAGAAYRSLPWPPGSAANWQNHAFPAAAAFVVELPPGPVSPARAARWVRALRVMALEGVRR